MMHQDAFQIVNVKLIFRPSEAPILQEHGRSKIEAAVNKQIEQTNLVGSRADLIEHTHRHSNSAIMAQRS
jgi:hypothetical protein